ncbi:MAG: metal-dependent hydrolase, partial [Planctomycetes bacterium]|nr:metal-dependent hydrolase [Planctomycetota bacterium]
MPLEITFLGHSGFLFDDGSQQVCVDPFLTGNQLARHTPADIRCDYLALTHGHADHMNDDGLAIARNNGATVVSVFEICNYFAEQGHDRVEPGNPGGRVHTDFGYIAFTPAIHSSSHEGRYMGMPAGLILRFESADVTVYHTGDTALFGDMKLIGQLARPDIMCVCTGDRFTMGTKLATMAVDL